MLDYIKALKLVTKNVIDEMFKYLKHSFDWKKYISLQAINQFCNVLSNPCQSLLQTMFENLIH